MIFNSFILKLRQPVLHHGDGRRLSRLRLLRSDHRKAPSVRSQLESAKRREHGKEGPRRAWPKYRGGLGGSDDELPQKVLRGTNVEIAPRCPRPSPTEG